MRDVAQRLFGQQGALRSIGVVSGALAGPESSIDDAGHLA